MKKIVKIFVCTALSCSLIFTSVAVIGAQEGMSEPTMDPPASPTVSTEPSTGPAISEAPLVSELPLVSEMPLVSETPLASQMPTVVASPSATPFVSFKMAFPDTVFRNYVNEKILGGKMIDTSFVDQEVIGQLGAYSGTVDLSFKQISDMTGIEFLTGITELNVEGNYIKVLDVSKQSKLTALNCADNDIRELNVTSCPELLSLKCQYNRISQLDLTKNSKLEEINVYQNALLSLSKTAFVTANLKQFTYAKMSVTLSAVSIDTQYGVVLPADATVPITSSLPDNARYLAGSHAIVWSNLMEIPSEFTYEYLAGSSEDIVRVTVNIDKSQIIHNLAEVGKPETLTAVGAGYNSVKLTWKKVEGVSGYRIYRSLSENGTFALVKAIAGDSTVTYTNKSLACGTKYYYKVRAYRAIEKNNYFGEYTTIANAKPVPAKAEVALKKAASTKVTVSWKKVSGATGYRIYRSTSKTGAYKKVKSVTNGGQLTWTNTKLKRMKTYYYKVRAYRNVDGKNIYGAYSAIKYRKL